ncbi:MAG: fructose-6-phosphate aldolase [Euryarchaeota archaeon]|nr:fructose-6-phosphate aldolase [Euryarchaeota archaeon]
MKLFIDSANLAEIREALSWGLVDGVTTNPTLIAKERAEPTALIAEICRIVDGPISVETCAMKGDEMVADARELSKVHQNITVKIPMTTEGLKATRILSRAGIKTNLTLVFTPVQAMLAAKAGATFVSPFIGRLDDIGATGMDVVRDTVQIYRNYGFRTEIIVASIRHPIHVLEAARAGAHIGTVPFKVLELLTKHPLTTSGIERFLEDWQRVPKKQP